MSATASGRLPRVLFVCVENAGRSQMAQALYERLGGDVRGRRPRGLARGDVEWAELVVTMGCGDACPVLPGKRYLDWNLPDPADAPIEEVRSLRDEIERRVAE